MNVAELSAVLGTIPGDVRVVTRAGIAITSAAHVSKGHEAFLEHFCELVTQGQEHTPNFEDIVIQRETGFKNRDELIAAYKALKPAA